MVRKGEEAHERSICFLGGGASLLAATDRDRRVRRHSERASGGDAGNPSTGEGCIPVAMTGTELPPDAMTSTEPLPDGMTSTEPLPDAMTGSEPAPDAMTNYF